MKLAKTGLACSAAALVVCFFFPTATVFGAMPKSVCTDYPSSEVVFVGTLTDFTPVPTLSSMKFEALEPLTGENINSITVLREPGSLCRNPDPRVIGERYLVIAQGPDRGGEYSCAELKREADAASDIEYFRLAESGVTPTEISGTVRVVGEVTPIKGAKVEVSGTAGQTQLTSNAKGNFHAVLKPGTYSVKAEFPAGYEAENCGWSMFTVNEHRCVRLAICAKPKVASRDAIN
jgi:Carboxypeptidase regulatory-like domain